MCDLWFGTLVSHVQQVQNLETLVWKLWFGIVGLEPLVWDLWFGMLMQHLRKLGNFGLESVGSGSFVWNANHTIVKVLETVAQQLQLSNFS